MKDKKQRKVKGGGHTRKMKRHKKRPRPRRTQASKLGDKWRQFHQHKGGHTYSRLHCEPQRQSTVWRIKVLSADFSSHLLGGVITSIISYFARQLRRIEMNPSPHPSQRAPGPLHPAMAAPVAALVLLFALRACRMSVRCKMLTWFKWNVPRSAACL